MRYYQSKNLNKACLSGNKKTHPGYREKTLKTPAMQPLKN